MSVVFENDPSITNTRFNITSTLYLYRPNPIFKDYYP